MVQGSMPSKTGQEIEPKQVTPQNPQALQTWLCSPVLNPQQTPLSGKKQVKTWGAARGRGSQWSAQWQNLGHPNKQFSEKDRQPGIDPHPGPNVLVPAQCCLFYISSRVAHRPPAFDLSINSSFPSLQRVRQVTAAAEWAAHQCKRHRNSSGAAAVGFCLPEPFLRVTCQAESPGTAGCTYLPAILSHVGLSPHHSSDVVIQPPAGKTPECQTQALGAWSKQMGESWELQNQFKI